MSPCKDLHSPNPLTFIPLSQPRNHISCWVPPILLCLSKLRVNGVWNSQYWCQCNGTITTTTNTYKLRSNSETQFASSKRKASGGTINVPMLSFFMMPMRGVWMWRLNPRFQQARDGDNLIVTWGINLTLLGAPAIKPCSHQFQCVLLRPKPSLKWPVAEHPYT